MVKVEHRRIHRLVSYKWLLLFLLLSKFFRSRHQANLRSLSVLRYCLAALLQEVNSSSLALRDERHFF